MTDMKTVAMEVTKTTAEVQVRKSSLLSSLLTLPFLTPQLSTVQPTLMEYTPHKHITEIVVGCLGVGIGVHLTVFFC